jgi:nicotinamidase-related amidase
MPTRSDDLYGDQPERSKAALLLIDLINDLVFPGSDALAEKARRMAPGIRDLKARAKEHGIPVIYVNDNFGRWRSDFGETIRHVIDDDTPGGPVAQLLRPDRDDYFVLKPKHSGFYSTTLEPLLNVLSIRTLILTGMAGNICVLFTANDAYMRDYYLYVPKDCSASNTKEENAWAFHQMQSILKADTRCAAEIDLERLARGRPVE